MNYQEYSLLEEKGDVTADVVGEGDAQSPQTPDPCLQHLKLLSTMLTEAWDDLRRELVPLLPLLQQN